LEDPWLKYGTSNGPAEFGGISQKCPAYPEKCFVLITSSYFPLTFSIVVLVISIIWLVKSNSPPAPNTLLGFVNFFGTGILISKSWLNSVTSDSNLNITKSSFWPGKKSFASILDILIDVDWDVAPAGTISFVPSVKAISPPVVVIVWVFDSISLPLGLTGLLLSSQDALIKRK